MTPKVLHIYLFLLLVLPWLGCQDGEKTASVLLTEADALVYEYPDSALRLLETIPHPERLQGQEQADYALLMTQARSRCHITATSDSLIRIAVDYYQSATDNPRKATTLLYLADVYMDMKKNTEAVVPLKQAEEVMKGAKPHIQSLVYAKLGFLNRKSGNYSLAIEYYKKGQAINKKYNFQEWYVSNLVNIINLPLPEIEDSISFYVKELKTVLCSANPDLQGKAYNNIGVYYYKKGQWKQAEEFYQKAIAASTSVPYRSYLNLARIYDAQGHKGRADSLYQQGLLSPVEATRAIIYKNLYKRYLNDGRYQEAIDCIDRYQIAADSFYQAKLKDKTMEAQLKYDQLSLQHKNALLEKNLYLVILIVVSIFAASSLIIRFYRRKQQELTSIIHILQQQIDDLKTDMFSKNEQEKVMLQKKIDQLEKLKSIYISQAHLDTAEIKAAGTMKIIVKELKYTPKNDRSHLALWLNTYRNGFAIRLEQTYPQLTQERQLDVCYLSAAGFDAKHIARLLGLKERTIEHYMTDICKKVQYPEEGKRGFQSLILQLCIHPDIKKDAENIAIHKKFR